MPFNNVFLSCCFVGVLLLGGGQINAQAIKATFDIVTRPPNYQAYESFDECIAAINRMVVQTDREYNLRADTAQINYKAPLEPLDDSVRIVGNLCARKTLVDSLPRESAKEWAYHLLRIGRSDDAFRLMSALLDSLSPYEGVSQSIDFLRTLVARRPLDLTFVERLYDRVNQDAPRDSICMLALFRGVRVVLYDRIRDERTHSIRNEFLATADSAMENLEACPAALREPLMATAFMHRLRHTEKIGLDSLATNTAAYRNYLAGETARASRGLVTSFAGNGAIGQPFPRLEGTFWYESRAHSPFTDTSYTGTQKFSSVPPSLRPIPGKINLVVRLGSNCHELSRALPYGRLPGAGTSGGEVNCKRTAAALRRILIAHPDVVLTIFVSTLGVVGNVTQTDPEAESRLLAKFMFEHYRLPGVLVIEQTEFIRLPEPDNRRIDLPVKMSEAVKDSMGIQWTGDLVFLVDPDGKVVSFQGIVGDREDRMIQMIRAIKRRT